MTRRWTRIGVVALLLLLLDLQHGALAQGPVPRLVADNKTVYYVDVFAWNGSGWNFIIRLMPGNWTAFPNAQNGSQWRAVIGQVVRDHRVVYVFDPGYGGYQDVWRIQ